MEAIGGSSESQVKKAKTGLEGTGLDLPPNRHGNLKSASSDQNFKEILMEIKTSKTPVTFRINIKTFFFFSSLFYGL